MIPQRRIEKRTSRMRKGNKIDDGMEKQKREEK
jgi:hypothetical protein